MFKLSLRLIIVENSCSKLHGVIPAMHLPVAVFLWSFNQDFQLSLQFSLIHSSGSISGSRTFLISSGGCLSCCLNVSQTLSVTSTSTSISTNLCLCLYPFNSNGSFRSCRCWRCSSNPRRMFLCESVVDSAEFLIDCHRQHKWDVLLRHVSRLLSTLWLLSFHSSTDSLASVN